MKASRYFIVAAVIAAVAGLWLSFGPTKQAKEGSSTQVWHAPPTTYTNHSVYSVSHNTTMMHLWNDVRLKEHWDSADAEFIVNCLSDPPTFIGSDWDQAELKQNESVCRYMNSATIFAEHLQIGGTIDGPSVELIKSSLVDGLSNLVPFVRAHAAAALILANCLDDPALRTRLEGMKADKVAYVRSVVKVQFENLENYQKAARGKSAR